MWYSYQVSSPCIKPVLRISTLKFLSQLGLRMGNLGLNRHLPRETFFQETSVIDSLYSAIQRANVQVAARWRQCTGFFCHFLPNQLVELVLNVENCVAGKKACASDFVVLFIFFLQNLFFLFLFFKNKGCFSHNKHQLFREN